MSSTGYRTNSRENPLTRIFSACILLDLCLVIAFLRANNIYFTTHASAVTTAPSLTITHGLRSRKKEEERNDEGTEQLRV